MIRLVPVLLVGLMSVLLSTLPAKAGSLLPAPYQVQGVVQYRGDVDRGGDGLSLGAVLVAVDLGGARGKAVPTRDALAEITLLGTAGSTVGRLREIVKQCDFLCGDEGEECHYVALIEVDGSLEALGTPLAALAGRHETAGFAAAAPSDGAALLDGLAADLSAPVWDPHLSSNPVFRLRDWQPEAGTATLDLLYGTGEPTAVALRSCRASNQGGLVGLACGSLAMLLADGRPLLVSYPDYNLPAAEVVAGFHSGGLGYRLVRLGLKAQTVFGLLAETPDGWRARIRPRDYALLC